MSPSATPSGATWYVKTLSLDGRAQVVRGIEAVLPHLAWRLYLNGTGAFPLSRRLFVKMIADKLLDD